MRLTVSAVALLVGLVPALSGAAAEAAPGPGGSFRPAVQSGNTFLESLWGFVSRLWSKAGSIIDPLGVPNEAGCSLDPLGPPCNKAGSDFDPLGAPTGKAGSGYDPLGAPTAQGSQSASAMEAGCDVDPLGRCRAIPQP